jgi:hypothetical protein
MLAATGADQNRKPSDQAGRQRAIGMRTRVRSPRPADSRPRLGRPGEAMTHRPVSAPPGRDFAGLGLVWLLVLVGATALVGTLQVLGPPLGTPARTDQTDAKPHPESIAALLNKVEDAITVNPAGAPPGAEAAAALKQVAAALPGAAREDRQLAKEVASDLFDRARIALNAGKIDEEQHWLALGSILEPPPDFGPAAENVARSASAGKAAGQQAPPAPAQPPTGSADVAAADKAGSGQVQNAAGANASASGLAIHVAANSAAAGATAKALADRLGAGARTESVAASEAPPGAVICYTNPDDHDRAKTIGEMLGGMGYYWRLQRSPSPQTDGGATHIDVWLPPGASTGRPLAALPENYCAEREYR